MEAHNGYLQIYLDLGLIGLFLLCTFLIATYRKICKRLKPLTALGSLGFGLWTLLLFYNVTEASFEVNLLFVTFLLSTISVTGCAGSRVTTRRVVGYDFSVPAANTETVDQRLQGAART